MIRAGVGGGEDREAREYGEWRGWGKGGRGLDGCREQSIERGGGCWSGWGC